MQGTSQGGLTVQVALPDPGCVLPVNKLVTAAPHKFRGPQVHVVADPEDGGMGKGQGNPGGRKEGWISATWGSNPYCGLSFPVCEMDL